VTEKVHPGVVVQEQAEVQEWVDHEGEERAAPEQVQGQQGGCVCPQCGTVASHEVGIPCYKKNCPKCGAKMVRK
jgi:hypothetical protein